MIVAKEIAFLKTAIEELEEKYCQNCQDWDCDYCWANTDDEEKREEEMSVLIKDRRWRWRDD